MIERKSYIKPMEAYSGAIDYARSLDIRPTPGLQFAREDARRHRDIADAAKMHLEQASDAATSVKTIVDRFQSELSEGEELRIIATGGGLPFFPTYVEAVGADRIFLVGTDDAGSPVMVLQHVTQLSVMLKVVKVDPEEARRADLGFHTPGAER